MKLIFTERAWDDYLWFQTNEGKILKKINALIKDIKRQPYEGLGKPEALKSNLSGYWSRRINFEQPFLKKIPNLAANHSSPQHQFFDLFAAAEKALAQKKYQYHLQSFDDLLTYIILRSRSIICYYLANNLLL